MGGSTIYVLIMQNGLSPQSKRKWNENYSGRLLKKSRLRMALVVVERILNEEGGWNWFRCCCVFAGSPVSYYMRTHVESVHSMYIVRKRKRMLATEKRCQKKRRDGHAPHLVPRSQLSSSCQSPGCSAENASVYLASETPTLRSAVSQGSFLSCRSLPPRSGSDDLPHRLAPRSFGPPGQRDIFNCLSSDLKHGMAPLTF